MKRKNIIICICTAVIIAATGLVYKAALPKDTKSQDTKLESFMKKNSVELNMGKEDDFKGFDLLDKDIEKSDVILTGEQHNMGVIYDLQIKFMKYLNQKYGVRYYLCEQPYSHTQLLNKYLTSGDEKYLNKFIEWSAGMSKCQERYKSLQDIYKYNSNLPDDKKIRFVGLDVEPGANVNPYLEGLVPDNDAPDDIKNMIKEFKVAVNFTDINQADEFYYKLDEDIKSHEKEYKNYLGDNFFDFQLIVHNKTNLKKVMELSEKKDNFELINLRNDMMYSEFKEIYNHFPKGKYYGEFGSEHIFLNINKDILERFEAGNSVATTLAKQMNSDNSSPVKGKVLCINYMFKTTDYRAKDGKKPCEFIEQNLPYDTTLVKVKDCNYKIYDDTYLKDLCQYVVISKDLKGIHQIN